MNFGEGFLIFPKEIVNKRCIKRTIIIKRNNKIILKGQIVDSKGMPISNAIVQVNIISYPYKVKTLGYTVCSENGEYLICIEKCNNVFYEFKIFSGLKK